mgnify:CR=1 FL=1
MVAVVGVEHTANMDIVMTSRTLLGQLTGRDIVVGNAVSAVGFVRYESERILSSIGIAPNGQHYGVNDIQISIEKDGCKPRKRSARYFSMQELAVA